MKTLIVGLVALGLAASPAFAVQSDAQIRQSIIRDSIAAYPGPCACPYSVMRNGRACGGRSAYSRPGGHAPICYPRDVTQAQIADYRRARR
jgi:hypothetical protein